MTRTVLAAVAFVLTLTFLGGVADAFHADGGAHARVELQAGTAGWGGG